MNEENVLYDYPNKENSKDIWSSIRLLKNSLNSKAFAKNKVICNNIGNVIRTEPCLHMNSLSFTYDLEQRDSNTQQGYFLIFAIFFMLFILFFRLFEYFTYIASF